jgi:predicted lipoprotein with Yx(FWY)xxD motif
MKTAPAAALLGLVAWCAGFAQAAPFNPGLAYPSEVALSDEGARGYVFRRFPGSQRLYFYDRDPHGHSACNSGCDSAWQPVYAPQGSKEMGDWTIIRRDNGLEQWAYQGHPVYTLYHDDPRQPQGDGQDGVWHLLPYQK